MTKDNSALKIKKIQEAYKRFELKINKLKKEQAELISQALEILDQQKVVDLIKKIKE